MADLKGRRQFEAEFTRSGAGTDLFVSAMRATRMPMVLTDPGRPDHPIVFANDAFVRLTGYGYDEIIGRNCRFLQGAGTDMAEVARVGAAIARREAIEIDLLNYKKNGERFWNRLLVSPVFDRDGELVYFFASQFDVTPEKERIARVEATRAELEHEVERRTVDLDRSEERQRFILKAGRLGSWTLDLSDMCLVASDTCKANLGRAPHEPFTFEDLIAAIHPEDKDRMQAAVRASIENGTDYDIEYRVRLPCGEVRWLLARGQSFNDAVGKPLSMAGVTIDVTDRKRIEEHRALLAEELRHRVKNTMATMQSIAHQTLRGASSLDEAARTLDARLRSLSTAHDMLTLESWAGAPLDEVARKALGPFQGGAGRFVIDGPEVWLPPRMTLALTMALHELATNAVKYGALSNNVGRVDLTWEIAIRSGPALLRICWEEADGPPVSAPTRVGFGSRLIERALATEMEGQAKIEYRPSGVRFTLEGPLPERAAVVADVEFAT